MSGYGRLATLVICSGQLLALNSHNNFNSRNKITNINVVILVSIFLHGKEIAPPYTSSYLIQNILSDWLWAPLLHLGSLKKALIVLGFLSPSYEK